jgi:hypothetical protein
VGWTVRQRRADIRTASGTWPFHTDRGLGDDVAECEHHHGEIIHLARRIRRQDVFRLVDVVVSLFCLLSRSGLAYGLDAVLAHAIPATLSSTLVGTMPGEGSAARSRAPHPIGSPAG